MKELWRRFTGESTKSQMLRFGYIGIQGNALMAFIIWLLLNVLKIEFHWWFIETWMPPFAVAATVAFFHNFFLNKLLGGITKIGSKQNVR